MEEHRQPHKTAHTRPRHHTTRRGTPHNTRSNRPGGGGGGHSTSARRTQHTTGRNPREEKETQPIGAKTKDTEEREPPNVQLHSVWAYLDGSAFYFNGDKVGSRAVVAHRDTTKAYASPCRYDTSDESEFWALVQFLWHLIKTGFRGSIGICLDNSQVVRIANKVLGKSLPWPSTSNPGIRASILEELQLYVHLSWRHYLI